MFLLDGNWVLTCVYFSYRHLFRDLCVFTRNSLYETDEKNSNHQQKWALSLHFASSIKWRILHFFFYSHMSIVKRVGSGVLRNNRTSLALQWKWTPHQTNYQREIECIEPALLCFFFYTSVLRLGSNTLSWNRTKIFE